MDEEVALLFSISAVPDVFDVLVVLGYRKTL
jgi:hypothetical protein